MAAVSEILKVEDQTVDPQDEFFHAIGNDPAWSESYYFYYFDPDQNIGGITRMGFRANDGWADSMHILFLEGRHIVFCYGRRDMERSDENLSVGGLTLVRGQPFKDWTINFDGVGQDITDGRILVTPRRDRPDGWYRDGQVKMSIAFEALADPFYMLRRGPEAGHFEQIGQAKGSIELNGKHWDFNGYGLRDKSWGQRAWKDTSASTKKKEVLLGTGAAEGTFNIWLTSVVGPHLAFAFTASQDQEGGLRSSGFLYRDGAYHSVTGVEVESEFEPESVIHKSNRFTATFEGGHSLSGQGTILNLGPSKVVQPGGATLVNSGMTRFRLNDGEESLGSSEYWIAVKRL